MIAAIAIGERIAMSEILMVRSLIEKMTDSSTLDTWLGPTILFLSLLISCLLPISALLYSLLHAINQKQEIRKKTLSHSVQDEMASVSSSS